MASRADKAKRRTAFAMAGLVACMVGLSFAAVPLYDMFCRVTGYGGTTQQAAAPSQRTADRTLTVRFDASVNGDLPWAFAPVERETALKVGENALAFYRAQNLSAVPVTGTAAFNVTPQKAGVYFTKVECFCFTEQRLGAGETMEMPVAFYVDAEFADDPDMADVNTITLSYTFFRAKTEDEPEQLAAGK